MNDNFRKVLIIAYYFPPMGLSGVQRTAKFAKYLKRYGWLPTVLTVEPGAYFAFDDSLLKEIEEAGVRVVRTQSLDMSRLLKKRHVIRMPSEFTRKLLQFFNDTFFIPDTKILWKYKAVRTAIKLHKQEKFDLIFATSPPQTDFLIGAKLKKKLGIPLVIDYRDAWLDYPFKYFPTPLHRFIHKHLERKVLKAADRVIVTHRRVKEGILKRYGLFDYNEIDIIPQGYDPEDILHVSKKKTHSSKMKITHAGTFYASRTPKYFLEALSNVLKADHKLRDKIEVIFIGNLRNCDQKLIQKLELNNIVKILGYLPHRECVEHLLDSDVLWFVIDNDYQTPGKLYEYFGTRKPIIASVVDGYTRRLLLESKAAICVDLRDVKGHEEAILEFYSKFEQKKLPRIPIEFSTKFDRLVLTGELAKVFSSLMFCDNWSFVKIGENDK